MKIMCCDDEELALQMLERAIQKAKPDADVSAFDDQDDLLEAAGKEGCDIAFLDIHMRGMNGVELARRLKEINPKMNIIFVTGYSEYAGEAMSLHASGYIMKPVSKAKVEKELADLRFPIIPKNDALLRVQCFGNFDVFTALSAARQKRCLRISCISRAAPAPQRSYSQYSLRTSLTMKKIRT